MRKILESCVRVEVLAKAAYEDMHARCTDPAVAELCAAMAEEEAAHIQWWADLIDAWDEGRLADTWTLPDSAAEQLKATVAELERYASSGSGPLDAETVLTTAARIEFFALDPVFSELLDLSEPGVARARHDAYSVHVARLVTALEKTFAADSLAGFLAQVLRRAELENGALSHYATMDPLTGLGNRRALAAQASQWSAWAARYGSAITFLMVDIDDFQSINDAWGHAVGDKVLVALSEAIKGALRSADLVARFGGDEFVVLAPELEPGDASTVAERLVEAVRDLRVDAGEGAYVTLTASVGVATAFDPPDSTPRHIDTMLAAANRSLHDAQKSGRDRAAQPVLLLHGLPLGE
jgi:diguanylate cyclase (GGDEF)-like protein